MAKQRSKPRASYHRVQATMPGKMVRWLEEIGRSCKDEGGYRISKCEIIRSAIESIRTVEKHIDVSEVRTEQELTERILDAFRIALAEKEPEKAEK